MQGKKNVIYAATFVISMIVGFSVVKLLKPSESEPPKPPVYVPEPEPEPVKEHFSYTETIVQRETHRGKKHGLKSDTVMDVTYETRYTGYTQNGDTLEKRADTKVVSRRIVRIDEDKQPVTPPDPTPIPKEMTEKEFSSMLNSGDEKLTGKGISINSRNLRNGDFGVSNVTDVHEKLNTKTWSKVKVISVQYNEQTGKLESAVIEPVYPE